MSGIRRLQHRRYSTSGPVWPDALFAGEVAVNPVRRQLAVGDFDGGTREFIGIRVYDERSQYVIGDLIAKDGTVYRCVTAIPTPHAYVPGEWKLISETRDDLETYFDTQYAAIGHNHDGVYSPVSHNHDGVYAPASHTHSQYALTTHNHDTVYGRLAAANSWTNTNTFAGVVNATGSYVTVGGNLSVGGGSGIFVPGAHLHVRTTGQTQILAQSTAAQQVRLTMQNPSRQMFWYLESNGSFAGLYDGSGNRLLAKFPHLATDEAEIFNKLLVSGEVVASTILRAGGVAGTTWFGTSAGHHYLKFTNDEYVYNNTTDKSLRFVTEAVTRMIVNDAGVNVGGSQVFDAAGALMLKVYTRATRPAGSVSNNRIIIVSDEFVPPDNITFAPALEWCYGNVWRGAWSPPS